MSNITRQYFKNNIVQCTCDPRHTISRNSDQWSQKLCNPSLEISLYFIKCTLQRMCKVPWLMIDFESATFYFVKKELLL